MTSLNQKEEILQSLNGLDAVQSEKVLDFIRDLRQLPESNVRRQVVKRRAMKEIGYALRHMQYAF